MLGLGSQLDVLQLLMNCLGGDNTTVDDESFWQRTKSEQNFLRLPSLLSWWAVNHLTFIFIAMEPVFGLVFLSLPLDTCNICAQHQMEGMFLRKSAVFARLENLPRRPSPGMAKKKKYRHLERERLNLIIYL